MGLYKIDDILLKVEERIKQSDISETNKKLSSLKIIFLHAVRQ